MEPELGIGGVRLVSQRIVSWALQQRNWIRVQGGGSMAGEASRHTRTAEIVLLKKGKSNKHNYSFFQ